MPSSRIYSPLDLRLPNISPRTGLYPVRPRGMGTPMVESLTSYITRIAQAHDVSNRALVANYLRFHIPKAQMADHSQDMEWKRHFLEHAHTLNGMQDRVKDWIFAVEESTGFSHLRYLTMINWSGIFSGRTLLRHRRAWCSHCYHDWRASDQEIYEPLLWAIADSICLIHQHTLTERCPHCKARPYVLAPRSRPGCCPLCHHWLGAELRRELDSRSDTGSGYSLSVTDSMAKLLAGTPLLEQPPSKDIPRANLENCVRDLAQGNASLFAHTVAINPCTLVPWFAEQKLPAFTSLTRICYRFGIPLFRFLTERLVAGDPDWEHARNIFKQYAATRVRVIRTRLPVLTCPDPAGISDRVVKKALQDALRQNPQPTIPQLAYRLGIRKQIIYQRFPGFHKILMAARHSQLEAAAKAALLESPPPTLRELEKQRGFPRETLRVCFPGLYRELAISSAQRYQRKREAKKVALQAACVEEPPQSGNALAARLGTSHGNLKRAFPESWKAIIQRHAEYKKREISKKRAAFAERVRRVATDLMAAGKYPARRKVLALKGDSGLRGESLIVYEVKQAFLAFRSRLEA